MANVTAIYCLKAKKDRTNVEMYRNIVNLINRQSRQGMELEVQGLFEAKKNFRCENFDDYGTGFIVAKGEYFLMVDGKSYDATFWRLMRACRTEKERQSAWILTGVPENEDVYDDSFDVEKRQAPKLDENKYFRQLPVEFPSSDEPQPSAFPSENYISVYDIREASMEQREDTWSIRKYMAEDFADRPEIQSIFKQLIQCNSPEDIKKIADRKVLVDELIRRHYDNTNELEPHHSLVIAVIDGKNDEWLCGIWCYRHPKKEEVEIHEVDSFIPDGYDIESEEIGMIPIFE